MIILNLFALLNGKLSREEKEYLLIFLIIPICQDLFIEG
jgi:hypothetical protein